MRILFTTFLALVSLSVVGTGLPERIVLDNKNAEALGFHLVSEGSGDGSTIRIVTVTFPKALNAGCEIGRIQSFLFDLNGAQVAGSSADYRSADEVPTLLVHYDFERFDMALQFQYLCQDGTETAYKYAYAFESLNNFLVTRRLSAGAPQNGVP